MTTMRHIADRAGVSLATVSHVINGTRYVSPELTARVREVLSELDYKPDAVARSLRRGATMTIGLIMPTVEIPFFASVASAIEGAAFEVGYSVILCNTEWKLGCELDYINDLLARRIDGLVCISATLTGERLAPVLEATTPVVMFERRMADMDLDAVGIHNEEGAYVMVTHLLSLGHERIAVIEGIAKSTLSGARLAGVRRALAEQGLTLDPTLVERGDFESEGGHEATARLMTLPSPPTAIFAFNDLMAIGALQYLNARGLRVPHDVAVAGFDGISLARYASPPLTTIRQPVREMGRRAVELLLARIRGDEPEGPQYVRLPAELVVRRSTDPTCLE